MTGRVIRGRGRRFTVLANGSRYECEVLKKAKQRVGVTPVAVGDLVEFTFNPPGPGGISAVHPRSSKFSRPRVGEEAKGSEQVIAANIDQMVIVVSVARPKFKQHLIDRFGVAAVKGGLAPAIIINKTDLSHRLNLEHISNIYRSLDMPVALTSCKTGSGIESVKEILHDHESILVGHSGVGKSSLLNAIQPGLRLRTREISAATSKGTHATTAVELYPLEFGGYVVDTPGLKVMGLWDLDKEELQTLKEELQTLFPEFKPYFGKCRFACCSHTHEPECAVKQAVSEGEVFSERYRSYARIYEDL
jgi:ribosome biogenesis GTPase